MSEGDNTIPKGIVWICISSPVYKKTWSSTTYYNTLNLNNINTDLTINSYSQSTPKLTLKCTISIDSYSLKINGYSTADDYIVYRYANGTDVMNISYSYINYTAGKTLTLPTLEDKGDSKFIGWYESNGNTGPWLKEITYASSKGSHVLYAKFTEPVTTDVQEKIVSQHDTWLLLIIASAALVGCAAFITRLVKIRRG